MSVLYANTQRYLPNYHSEIELEYMDKKEGHLDTLEKWVENEIEEIYKKAEMLSELFWTEKKRLMEYEEGKKGTLGCRVQRPNGKGISMTWVKYVFYRPKSMGGKVQRFSEHIKKPKNTFKYNLNKLFKEEDERMYETIEFVESRFAKYREQIDKLTKLKIWINEYKKMMKKFEEEETENSEEMEEKHHEEKEN